LVPESGALVTPLPPDELEHAMTTSEPRSEPTTTSDVVLMGFKGTSRGAWR
jgi:hypothetical protein